MFNKISSMLGKAMDIGSSLIKPLKNHVSNGWEKLKNGAFKVGQFVNDNHEAIGSILSGVGNIIGNMPNSPLRKKFESYGNTSPGVRPQNTRRQQFSNNLNSNFGGIAQKTGFIKSSPNNVGGSTQKYWFGNPTKRII